jgi:hypothetical protein
MNRADTGSAWLRLRVALGAVVVMFSTQLRRRMRKDSVSSKERKPATRRPGRFVAYWRRNRRVVGVWLAPGVAKRATRAASGAWRQTTRCCENRQRPKAAAGTNQAVLTQPGAAIDGRADRR